MISITDHLLIGLRASQPVTSVSPGCSVPFDRLVVAVSGTTWQRLVLGFLALPGPAPLKQVLVYASAAPGARWGITGSLWPPHRAQDLEWTAGMAHGGTARCGGSCFQRLSPYPVALSCALQLELAWASCPKSRFLFFALFFNMKTDCILHLVLCCFVL
jgi:hypothetical protein